MFKCQKCKNLSQPGVKAQRTVLETRAKDYFRQDKAGKDILIGQGTEIVRETLLCSPCAQGVFLPGGLTGGRGMHVG